METEDDSCVNYRNAKCKCKEMHLSVNYLLHNCQCKRSASTDAKNGQKWNDFHFLSLAFALAFYTCEPGQRKCHCKRRLKFLSFSFRLLMHLKKLEKWDNRAEISPMTFCRN